MAGGWRGRGSGDALQQRVAAAVGREWRLLRPRAASHPLPGLAAPASAVILPQHAAGGLQDRFRCSPGAAVTAPILRRQGQEEGLGFSRRFFSSCGRGETVAD